jgi:hypothetical protein
MQWSYEGIQLASWEFFVKLGLTLRSPEDTAYPILPFLLLELEISLAVIHLSSFG